MESKLPTSISLGWVAGAHWLCRSPRNGMRLTGGFPEAGAPSATLSCGNMEDVTKVGWNQRRFAAPAHHQFSTFPDGGPALEASWSHPTLKKRVGLRSFVDQGRVTSVNLWQERAIPQRHCGN